MPVELGKMHIAKSQTQCVFFSFCLQGTPKRWEVVASYVRTRTLEEVVFMVKEKQGMTAGRLKAQVCVYAVRVCLSGFVLYVALSVVSIA